MGFLTKKKRLELHPKGFSWKGTPYTFGEIRHLAFAKVLTSHSTNFIPTGKTLSAALEITLASGKKILMQFDEAAFFAWDEKAKIADLQEFYVFLAEQSFKVRLDYYLQDLATKGYFVIDECRFYPQDKVVFRNREFPVATSNFMKGQGYVELRKKDYRFWDKVKREISFRKIPQFSTVKDTDVVFCLLETYMGLSWR